jgi:hypothetical protein
VAWHCQLVSPIFVDLLRREEHLSLEEYDQYNIDSSTSAPGQNIDQVEPIWMPHHGQHCFRTADRLAFKCWPIFLAREPDLFVLIRETKFGFVQCNKIFPTLVLDGTQQIQEEF